MEVTDVNKVSQSDEPLQDGEPSEKDESKESVKFQVDKALIPSSDLQEMQAESELGDLGLTVFNQEDFEQGVMAQVDLALAKEEEERKKKQLQKEETDIKYDIAKVKKEIETLEKVISSLEGASNNSHVKSRLVSVQSQRQNKISQLKTLYARQRSIQIKLNGTSSIPEDMPLNQDNANLNQLLGLGSSKETEKEKMIRLGHMTPFGTVISSPEKTHNALQSTSKCDSVENEEDSNKTSSTSDKKETESSKSLRKVKSEPSVSTSFKDRDKRENYFDSRDKKNYRNDVEGSCYRYNYRSKRKYARMTENFREDSAMSDEENCYYDDPEGYLSDGDEYRPNEKELMMESSDDDSGEEETTEDATSSQKKRTRKKYLSRKKKPPKFSWCSDDENENFAMATKRKINRDYIERKCKDDGDEYCYLKRLEDFNESEKRRNKKIDAGEILDEDEELEGGLKVPGRIWSKLFNYQRVGVSWLWELHCQSAGGIIGDEMGLGKTIQMIAFLAALRQSKLPSKNFRYHGLGPTVIVTPTTVMYQWVKEFHKWWPLFRVAILHSSGSFTGNESELVRSIVKEKGVLITSFTTLVLHQDTILPYDWHYVVLDEGHKIRNPDAQITLAVKQFRTPHRIILSGSPIQNNLKELWSLFDFVFPGKLGTLPDFMEHFSVPIVQGGYANATETQVQTAYKCSCVLRDTINPYLLRRMKADVKINLPSKNEQVLFCRLTDEQTDVYMEYLQSRECQAILSGKYQIFAGLITLRKICNHPDISTGGPKLYIGEDTQGDPSLEYGYWRRSGKMIVVEALLKLWKKQGHRVLFFSQSRAMLDIFESFTQEQNYSYLRMDGGSAISTRQSLISTYNNDPSIYLFLLTTRVGGLGVNLTGANRVIIFDPDWNPSTDTQARERTWRIGQKKEVTIYRLITSGTIEEKIYHRQIFKQFLTNRVLKDPKQRRFFKSNDLYELFELGNKDNKEGTETSAIFAGTGSEVKRSDVKKGANRFDILSEKKKKEKKEKEISKNIEDEEEFFEQSEIDQMRELARKLSEKLMKGKLNSSKNSSEPDDASRVKLEAASGSGESSNDVPAAMNVKNGLPQELHSPDGIISQQCTNNSTLNCTESDSQNRLSQGCETLEQTQGESDQKHSSQKNDTGKKDSGSSSQKHSHKSSHKDKKKSSHKEHSRSKHKKKHKDTVFEGEKIPNLVKHGIYKPQKDKEQEAEKQDMDDYVLHKLFKKTGIQSAMKHDVIMDPNKHDYMIVESEANRVAKEASKALKRSRSFCNSATSGMPTWTGQSGFKKQRFGQKKNSLLVDKTKKTETQTVEATPQVKKPEVDTSKHFDGSLVGNVVKDIKTGMTTSNTMSSDLLLQQMKKRNEIVVPPGGQVEGEAEDQEEDTSMPVVDDDSFKLISEIKNFILFGCSMIGKASTQELLDEFGPKLPPANSAMFKAMLAKICVFERNNGIGFWKLKNEFR